jgi:hydrogenase expression/formation protein HypD
MSDERRAAASLVSEIARTAEKIGRVVRLMEVCGTHTVELRRQGIHSLLPAGIRLISGPGCPVCVTPAGYIDNALALVKDERATVATFGDMLKVPGSAGENLSAYSGTGRVKLVYSPRELVDMARVTKGPLVFLAVGFETTIPTIVAALREALSAGRDNLLLYTALKTVPPALRFLLSNPEHGIDGFILPGHVSVIIGAEAYSALEEPGGRPGVVTGFEAMDMLVGILMLLRLVLRNEHKVENAYTRAVRPGGNPRARAITAEALEPRDELWRGLGVVPGAGLGLRQELAGADAEKVLALPPAKDVEPPGCLCARVVTGMASPLQCALFGKRCTPDDPVGPCMVSSEGTCSAYFRYGADR